MNDQQSLIEVQKALPAELPNRFDTFLLKAHEATDGSAQILKTALDFVIDSEATFQIADKVQADLKGTSKGWNGERMALTRPIDDFKQQFLDAESGVTNNLNAAVTEYQTKMKEYLGEKEAETKRVQVEAERQIKEQNEAREREAQKLEQRAGTLKTDEAKQRALQQAQDIRTIAALTPTSIAAPSLPQAIASDIGEPWEVEEFEDMSDFLRWLADHPEWHSLVRHPKTKKVHFPVGEINRMARQFRDVVSVPGIKFRKTFSFRSKAK